MTDTARVRTRLLPKLVTALTLTSVGLAACGTDGSDSADPSGQQNEGLTVVTYAGTLTLNQVLPSLAMYGDYGKAHGIKLEKLETLTADSAAQLSAMQAGDTDFSTPGLNSAVDMVGAGADLKVVGALGTYAGGITVSTQALEASGVTLEDPIEDRIKALKGLTIAVGPDGSTSNAIFRLILDSVGLDADTDVNMIPLRDMSGVVAVGLEQGTYDAAFSPLGTTEPAIASGAAVVLGSVPQGDFPSLDNLVGPVLVATTDFVENNPETVDAVLATLEDARDAIVAQPDEVGVLLKEQMFPEMDQAVFDAAWPQAAAGFVDWDVEFGQDRWDMLVEDFSDVSVYDYSSMSFEEIVYQARP